MPRPACPKCKARECSRKKRQGLFERFILPRLGWYPWQCSSCRKVFLVKERGKRKRKPFAPGQNYTQWRAGDAPSPQPLHEHDELHDDQAEDHAR
jgi:hypothetical protein